MTQNVDVACPEPPTPPEVPTETPSPTETPEPTDTPPATDVAGVAHDDAVSRQAAS